MEPWQDFDGHKVKSVRRLEIVLLAKLTIIQLSSQKTVYHELATIYALSGCKQNLAYEDTRHRNNRNKVDMDRHSFMYASTMSDISYVSLFHLKLGFTCCQGFAHFFRLYPC